MARNNRTCYFCGKEYSYCPNCPRDREKPAWYEMWCSETCKELDHILKENQFGRLQDEEAAEQIKSIELPEITNTDNAAKIGQLLATKKKKTKTHISE